MARQILVPFNSIEDAEVAIRSLPDVSDPGDEVVMLAVLDVPEAPLVGFEPPQPVTESYIAMGGAGSTPRAPNDTPVFMDRDQLMEMQGREICEDVRTRTRALREGGTNVRVDAAFSETPVETIRDYAGDIDAAAIMVTSDFHRTLSDEDETLAEVLPGT